MNNLPSQNRFTAFKGILFGLALAVETIATVHAQGDIPSGTVSGSGSGSSYTYNLTFSDDATASAPIGSIWYAWVPGGFFLPSTPSGASAPAGWTANVVSDSVQFTANSPANDIAAGQTLSGFGFQASFTPAQLAAAPNGGESVAYLGAIEGDAGKTFNVQPVPEPSTVTLVGLGAAALCLVSRQRMRLR